MTTVVFATLLVICCCGIIANFWDYFVTRKLIRLRRDDRSQLSDMMREIQDERNEAINKCNEYEKLLRDCDESLLEILVWLGATEEGARMGDIREPVEKTIRELRRRIADTTGESR